MLSHVYTHAHGVCELSSLVGKERGWGGEDRGALGNNCLTRFQPAPGASINRRVAAGTNYMPTFLLTPFAYISPTGTEMTILFPTQVLHFLNHSFSILLHTIKSSWWDQRRPIRLNAKTVEGTSSSNKQAPNLCCFCKFIVVKLIILQDEEHLLY